MAIAHAAAHVLRVLSAPWTIAVLAVGRGGPRGRGTVATSCMLVAFLCSSADVLSRVAFTVHAVAGVVNAFQVHGFILVA